MTPPEIIRTLTSAFLALTPKQLSRLDEHRRKRTPICCGDTASDFFRDGAG